MTFTPPPSPTFNNLPYFYANNSFYLGSFSNPVNAITFVTVDYSQIDNITFVDPPVFSFLVDQGGGPILEISVVHWQQITSTLTFLVSRGIPGVSYTVTVNIAHNTLQTRSDSFVVEVTPAGETAVTPGVTALPSTGSGLGPSPINGLPVPPTGNNPIMIGSDLAFINTFPRYFVGSETPEGPNIMDQWYNNGSIGEFVTDGATTWWQASQFKIPFGLPVPTGPNQVPITGAFTPYPYTLVALNSLNIPANVPNFSSANSYITGALVNFVNYLYRAQTTISPGSFNPTQWDLLSPIVGFRTSDSYFSGAFVVNNNHLYQSNTAVSPGAFNATQWDQILTATGGTFTGPITITTPSGTSINVNKTSPSQNAFIGGQYSGSYRWAVVLGNSVTETGANVGSDFQINRYADNGTIIDHPFGINRATGGIFVTSKFTLNQTTGDAEIAISKASGMAGTDCFVSAKTNQIYRWIINMANGIAETGANAGSNFVISRYDDSGTFIDSPFGINRATGQVAITATPTSPLSAANKAYVDAAGGPIGAVIDYAGATPPANWLFCNGTIYNIATYPDLFTAIGNAYGGDGITTFAVPNAQGRVTLCSGGGFTLATTGGEATHVLTTTEMPSHTHTGNAHTHTDSGHAHGITDPTHSHPYTRTIAGVAGPFGAGSLAQSDAQQTSPAATNISINTGNAAISNTTSTVQNAGSGGAHNNLQPYIVFKKIIRAL